MGIRSRVRSFFRSLSREGVDGDASASLVRGHDPASRADRVRAMYDAAAPSKRNARHWSAVDFLSPDASASYEVRRTIRARARYEIANSPLAAGMISTFVNDIIGTGPRLSLIAEIRNRDDRAMLDVAGEIEMKFAAHMAAAKVPMALRSMTRARVGDGETFGLLRTNRGVRSPIALDIGVFEADQFTRAQSMQLDDELDGIEIDQNGNPVRYFMLDRHPGSMTATGTGVSYGTGRDIPAAQVMHWAFAPRPGQIRGVSMIAPALAMFGYLRRFTLATIATAEGAATIGGVIHSQAPPVAGEDNSFDDFDPVDLDPASWMTLPEGWDIKQFKAEHPNAQFEAFRMSIINEIARCLDMPLNVAAANSSDYNYASGRLDHQTYDRRIEVERSEIETLILERFFAAWAEEAVLVSGYLSNAARALLGRLDGVLPAHRWIWPSRPHVDPAKEANASKVLLESGLTTLAHEFARRGQDWEEALEQRSREIARARQLGIPAYPGDIEHMLTNDDGQERDE